MKSENFFKILPKIDKDSFKTEFSTVKKIDVKGEFFLIDDKRLYSKNLNYIEAEMATHAPICCFTKATDCLILDQINLHIIDEFKKHNIKVDFVQKDIELLERLNCSTKNYDIYAEDSVDFLQNAKKEFYDLIVADAKKIDVIMLAYIKNSLKNSGSIVLIDEGEDILDIALLERFKDFRVVMPYFAKEDLIYQKSFLYIGREFHLLSDFNLQKAESLENLQYYTPDIHTSSTVMPKNIYKNFRSHLKL